jgi:hypothetical protein
MSMAERAEMGLGRLRAILGLRGLIIEGALEPGARVLEQTLVDRLGVSRTPARAALIRPAALTVIFGLIPGHLLELAAPALRLLTGAGAGLSAVAAATGWVLVAVSSQAVVFPSAVTC